MSLENKRFIFFLPDTGKSQLFGIVRIRNTRGKYYVIDLRKSKFAEKKKELIYQLRRLYTPLGGKELRTINIPEYRKIIGLIKNILKDAARLIYRTKYTAEFFVIKYETRNGINVIVILDLRSTHDEFYNIPVAWGHEQAKGSLPETYCIVIGYKDVADSYVRGKEGEETEEAVIVKRGFVCPLTLIHRESKNNIEKYLKNICPRVRVCRSIEDKYVSKGWRQAGKLYGSDKIQYVIDTHSSIEYRAISKEEDHENKFNPVSFIQFQPVKADIYMKLYGFRLSLRRYPRAFIANIPYDDAFRFESLIYDTNALKIRFDSRWLLTHYIYHMFNDPYLFYYTALKILLIKKAKGIITDPSSSHRYPQLTISALRKVLYKYLKSTSSFEHEFNIYTNRLLNIDLKKDKDILRIVEIIAIHTFAHLLYLAVLDALNTSWDELGFVINRAYMKSNESEEDNIVSEYLSPKYYEMYIFEKADGGLGYFDPKGTNIFEFITNKMLGSLNTLKNMFSKLDKRITEYRKEIYNSYYNEAIKKAGTIGSSKINEIINELAELSRRIKRISHRYGRDYTLIPVWLIRYGTETIDLNDRERRVFSPLLPVILSSLYDIYWDTSPNDLVIKYECAFYDLIQHFTLSRIYAEHIIDDLIRSVKTGKPIINPIQSPMRKVIFDFVRGSSINAYYSPWIDEEGESLIKEILENEQLREVYIVVRNREEAEKLRGFRDKRAKIIPLETIFTRPLHGKLFVSDNGVVLNYSANLLETSLIRNIESYSAVWDPMLAKSLLGFTKLLYNTYLKTRSF